MPSSVITLVVKLARIELIALRCETHLIVNDSLDKFFTYAMDKKNVVMIYLWVKVIMA